MRGDDVFRCAYCGTLTPVRRVVVWWIPTDRLADGRQVVDASVYCSTFCGEQHAAGSVGRG